MTKPRTGTLAYRGRGTWRLQVVADPDPVSGEPRRISRTMNGTRAEAKAALQRFVVEATGTLAGGDCASVCDLLDQFMVTAVLSPTTSADWRSLIDRHLKPALGELPIWKVTARHCDDLYVGMRTEGIGAWRVRNAHVVLHRAFAQAVRWGWLVHNPVSAANRPPVPRTEIVPPTAEVVRRALKVAKETDPAMHCFLLVALATGARRGEICAIRWRDVDFVTRIVRISSSVSQTSATGVVVKGTKTDRPRVVSLTASSVEALRERRAELALAGDVSSAAFVFSTDLAGGHPWPPALATRRWRVLRERAGLGRVRIHDLRHFVATELLSAGVDARTVSNRLGHARTSTTFDIYWAWVPARDREAADLLEMLLQGG
ncbi:MAG: tyrosine-type recombinase/integrase [Acidimicrobiales bacterium]